MWKKIKDHLQNYPERLTVARVLVENGLSVKKGSIYCNKIMISTVGISRVAGVDRRTVIKTIRTIEEHPDLRVIFSNIKPAGTSLAEVARQVNFGVVEITPTNAGIPGILASAAQVLADKKINIRQAIVDDPELFPDPKLVLIAEKKISGDIISKLLKIEGISKVTTY